MTQEDKELLLKDLCARLPYEVMVREDTVIYDDKNTTNYCVKKFNYGMIGKGFSRIKGFTHDYEYIYRPYLFPLSSLTEKQRNEISQLLIDTQNTFSPYGEINTKGCDNLFVCSVKQSNALIKYCLNNHLDIKGLIEKGLALDATGLNIY